MFFCVQGAQQNSVSKMKIKSSIPQYITLKSVNLDKS